MPLLKVVGPIPATAWIPLAMVFRLRPLFSAVALVALAVWFPVTMLTASGISNTRASYLDVARTLGAGRGYLIFRVAVPAALPNIFIGLFMGLGASFLTLVVAETVGVKSGLGWYVSWAQGWAEYGKVFAALVIMAAFFSTIMTSVQGARPHAGLAKGSHQMVIDAGRRKVPRFSFAMFEKVFLIPTIRLLGGWSYGYLAHPCRRRTGFDYRSERLRKIDSAYA